jgi:hypothetical protein
MYASVGLKAFRMRMLFLASVASGLAYYCCALRRMDFCALFFLSGVVYSAVSFRGAVDLVRPYAVVYIETPPEAYLFMTLFFLAVPITNIVISSLNSSDDLRLPPLTETGRRSHFDIALLAQVLAAALFCDFARSDPKAVLFGYDKAALLKDMVGRSYTLFQLFTIYGVFCAWFSGSRKLIASSACLVLLDVWLGFRVVLVLSALCVIVCREMENPRVGRLCAKWRILLAGSVLLYSALAVRQLWSAVKTGDSALWEQNLKKIMDPVDMMLDGEVQASSMMFYVTVICDIRKDMEYFFGQLLSVIPFGPEFGLVIPEGYNIDVQEGVLRVSLDTVGLASTAMGEWYAVFGYSGAVLLGVSYTVFICALQRVLVRRPLWRATIVIALTFVAFFTYRNGITQIINIVRNVVLSGAVLALWARWCEFRRLRLPVGQMKQPVASFR